MDTEFKLYYSNGVTRTNEGVIYDLYLNGKAPLDRNAHRFPKGKLIGRIGKTNGTIWDKPKWIATPLIYNPFDSDIPRREFKSRKEAALWLLGIADAKSETFQAMTALFLIKKGRK